jgi:hypothetical protein
MSLAPRALSALKTLPGRVKAKPKGLSPAGRMAKRFDKPWKLTDLEAALAGKPYC